MAVEVNWKRLKATHRELGGEGTLIVLLLPDQPVTVEALDDALVEDPYPIDEGPTNGGWFPGPKGWLLLLEADVDQRLWDWIGQLADRLTQLGITGSLTGARGAGRIAWAIPLESPFPSTTAGGHRLIGLLGYQPLPSEAMYPPGWGAEPTLLDTVLDRAMPWTLADADQAKVFMGSVSIAVPPAHATTLSASRMATSYVGFTTGYARSKSRIRSLHFQSPAAVELRQRGHHPDAWADVVADLRQQLLTAPRDTLTLARVDLNDWSGLTSGADDGRFSHSRGAFGLYPDLWGEWSPEPCPIQILTTTHLAKAHDLSDWTLTQLDPHHWLVETPDLTPWYTTFGPHGPRHSLGYHYPPDLLTKARHDFGDMILTPDKAEALGLTTRPIHRKPTGLSQ